MALSQAAPETLITYYLEMTDPAQFIPATIEADDVQLIRMTQPDVRFYLFMYDAVGYDIRWRDRHYISAEDLAAALAQAHIWLLMMGGAPAGYVELVQTGDSIEVAYFGVRAEYQGRGLGKHLLSFGIARAWELGARRVWVHTCNMDGEHALPNYRKRGFRVYDETYEPMPERYKT